MAMRGYLEYRRHRLIQPMGGESKWNESFHNPSLPDGFSQIMAGEKCTVESEKNYGAYDGPVLMEASAS
jgi:hypothetical protein